LDLSSIAVQAWSFFIQSDAAKENRKKSNMKFHRRGVPLFFGLSPEKMRSFNLIQMRELEHDVFFDSGGSGYVHPHHPHPFRIAPTSGALLRQRTHMPTHGNNPFQPAFRMNPT
jgi:hypothetical protein